MAKIKAAIEEHRVDPRLLDERGPTPERANQLRPSPINMAVADGRLSREHGIAAEKFYVHWYRAGLSESFGSADLNRVFGGEGGGSGMARTEAQAFHRQRYRAAVQAVEDMGEPGSRKGVLNAWALEHIVCHEIPFVEIGGIFGHKNRNSAARIALEKLKPALNILCMEWGVI
jgi:hypothetical protein